MLLFQHSQVSTEITLPPPQQLPQDLGRTMQNGKCCVSALNTMAFRLASFSMLGLELVGHGQAICHSQSNSSEICDVFICNLLA